MRRTGSRRCRARPWCRGGSPAAGAEPLFTGGKHHVLRRIWDYFVRHLHSAEPPFPPLPPSLPA